MNLYLVFKDGHQFLIDPTPEQMKGTEVLARRFNLSLGCLERAKFLLLEVAALDMFKRSLEKMLPDRPVFFFQMAKEFESQVPPAFLITWKVTEELGWQELQNRHQPLPILS